MRKILFLVVMPFVLTAQTKIIDPPYSYEFTEISSSTATFIWSASPGLATTGTSDGYLVVYRFDTPVDGVPTNGVSYSFGDPIGSSTAFGSGSSRTVAVSYPNNAIIYWRIYAYSSINGIRTYSATGLNLVTRPPAFPGEPSNQASNIAFNSITSSGFNFSYAMASGADGHFIMYKEGSAPSYVPVDGSPLNFSFVDGAQATYTVGSNSGSVSNAKSGTTYYFKIYSFNYYTITDGYLNYKITNAASGSVTTLAAASTQPTSQPTNLSFSSVTGSGFNYSFTGATGPPDGYLGVIRKGASPTGVPVDNTVYAVDQTLGDGKVDFIGTSTSGVKTGQQPGHYYYDVFSYNNAAIRVSYYNNRIVGQGSFSQAANAVDNVAVIDFNWGTGSPKAGVNTDNFSARFTFKIKAPVTGTYTFHTTSDDGVILKVNNTEIINKWLAQAPTTYTGTISLTAGQTYDVEILYVELTGGAVLKLEWTPPGQTKTLVRPAVEPSVNFLTTSPLQSGVCINPPKPTISANNTNPEAPLLTSNSDSGNQWYLNGNIISGATNKTHIVTAAGVYTVKVTVDDCVSEASNGSTYVITGESSPSFVRDGLILMLYPNPVSNEMTVQWNSSSPTAKKLSLFDVMGRTVLEVGMEEDELTLDVASLPPGRYLVRGSQGSTVVQNNFIKK